MTTSLQVKQMKPSNKYYTNNLSYSMISPHTAIIFKAFASQSNVDIMKTLYKHRTLKMMDIESIVGQNHGTINYHLKELTTIGLVEKVTSIYDEDYNRGYQLTKKGKHIIESYNDFTIQENKL